MWQGGWFDGSWRQTSSPKSCSVQTRELELLWRPLVSLFWRPPKRTKCCIEKCHKQQRVTAFVLHGAVPNHTHTHKGLSPLHNQILALLSSEAATLEPGLTNLPLLHGRSVVLPPRSPLMFLSFGSATFAQLLVTSRTAPAWPRAARRQQHLLLCQKPQGQNPVSLGLSRDPPWQAQEERQHQDPHPWQQ